MTEEGKSFDPAAGLPELLAEGLYVVFVGINPGLYSARMGHYFARPTNRFWPAFSRSRLSAGVQEALGRDLLLPEDDALLNRFGFGFTDVVLQATANASTLGPQDYAQGAPRLIERLVLFAPRVACFNGVTAFRGFARYALGKVKIRVTMGPQAEQVGNTKLFVVPSTSPANAHFRLADHVEWYDRLADFLDRL